MNLSPQTRLSIPDHVDIREVSGEAVILNLESEEYFGLDEVGLDFWTALTTTETVADAIEHLLGLYDADEKIISEDVYTLIEELSGHGLLEVEGE